MSHLHHPLTSRGLGQSLVTAKPVRRVVAVAEVMLDGIGGRVKRKLNFAASICGNRDMRVRAVTKSCGQGADPHSERE